MLYAMLGISLLLFAVGAFAWFTVTATSTVENAQIQAITEGTLRVYSVSPNQTVEPTGFGDYKYNVNFSSGQFADAAIANAKRTNISGNGTSFFRLIGGDSPSYSAGVDGIHDYVQFKLYFTGYNGDSTDTTVKYVYLTGNSAITKVGEASDPSIIAGIRVAFLNAAGTSTIGIWAPHATVVSGATHAGNLNYVKSTDTYPSASGILGYTKSGDTPLYETLRVINGDLDGGKIQATPLLPVVLGTAHSTSQAMVVRIWIEGADAATVDANLRALSNIKMNFGVATLTEFAEQPQA
jgi:hypothetical protein